MTDQVERRLLFDFKGSMFGYEDEFVLVEESVNVCSKEQTIRDVVDRGIRRHIATVLAHGISIKPTLLFRRDQVCHIRFLLEPRKPAHLVPTIDSRTEIGGSICFRRWRSCRLDKARIKWREIVVRERPCVK